MLLKLFYLLFLGMVMLGLGGFLLNADDAGPKDLYLQLVGDRGMIAEDSPVKKDMKAQEIRSHSFIDKLREDRLRLKDTIRDMRARLSDFKQDDRNRRRESDERLDAQRQVNKDELQRQKDKMRDTKAMYESLMASRRNSDF